MTLKQTKIVFANLLSYQQKEKTKKLKLKKKKKTQAVSQIYY